MTSRAMISRTACPVTSAAIPSSARKSSKLDPICGLLFPGFGTCLLHIPFAFTGEVKIVLRRLLRLLDETVQQYHRLVMHAEDHAGDSVREIDPHLPQTIGQRRANRLAD